MNLSLAYYQESAIPFVFSSPIRPPIVAF